MPMEEKRRTKRSSKVLDEGRWDCSVCTYSNSQEAFKCEMCDVRKGTSTRKPKLNPTLVAQQVSPQYTQPPPKKEKSISQSSKGERRKSDASVASSVPSPSPSVSTSPPSPQSSSSRDATSLTAASSSHSNPSTPTTTAPSTEKQEKPEKPNRKNRPPRLKNIDRSSATSMEVTVGNVTVIITDYKPKKEKERRTSVDTSHNGTSALHNPPPPTLQSDSIKTENEDTNGVSIKNETLATNGEILKEEDAS